MIKGAVKTHAVHVGAVPGPVVGDGAGRARFPALTGHEVAHVVPRHVVRAGGAVVVSHGALAVRPEGVEELHRGEKGKKSVSVCFSLRRVSKRFLLPHCWCPCRARCGSRAPGERRRRRWPRRQ